jgi:hypothetical protein
VPEDASYVNDSGNESMSDLLDMKNTLTEDEEDEYDTCGHIPP